MHVTKPAKVGIWVLAGLIVFVTTLSVLANREYRALQKALGTQRHPVYFQADSIQVGMSRDEVLARMKGYKRMRTYRRSATVADDADVFVFAFGPSIPLLDALLGDEAGSILVLYDANGRVKEKPRADMN